MLDYGASHNLMPKAIMEKWGLYITLSYHDLYSFDSGRVRCIGLIKDLMVSLDQIPAKNVLMDVVVAHIPPCGLNDLDFQLIEVDGVREISECFRVVLNQEKKKVAIPSEQPSREQKVSEEQKNEATSKGKIETIVEFQHLEDEDGLWSMDFDGALGKDGADNVARKPTLVPTDKGVEDINIGTTDKPKIAKLSKTLSPELKDQYFKFLSEFPYVFVWDYLDLKLYDKNIIHHTVPIKSDQKPFREKLRRINPKLMSFIKKEVNRLFKAGIIVPIRFFDWVSNLVPVQEKTGEIRLCINFRNLNKVSLKDNYPLPKMDHILHRVVGASRMSLLDGYSGYNKLLVHKKDQDKTPFTTPWGNFQYTKMPFGLNNVRATFQWAWI
eukprot:PITA_11030